MVLILHIAFLACLPASVVLLVGGRPGWAALVFFVALPLLWAARNRAAYREHRAGVQRSRHKGFEVGPDGWLRSGNAEVDEWMRAWWKTWGSLESGPRNRMSELLEMWTQDRSTTHESAEQFLNEVAFGEVVKESTAQTEAKQRTSSVRRYGAEGTTGKGDDSRPVGWVSPYKRQG